MARYIVEYKNIHNGLTFTHMLAMEGELEVAAFIKLCGESESLTLLSVTVDTTVDESVGSYTITFKANGIDCRQDVVMTKSELETHCERLKYYNKEDIKVRRN